MGTQGPRGRETLRGAKPEQAVVIGVRPDMQHAPPTADDHATCAYSGLHSLASLLHEQEEREAQQRQARAEPAAKAAGDEGDRT